MNDDISLVEAGRRIDAISRGRPYAIQMSFANHRPEDGKHDVTFFTWVEGFSGHFPHTKSLRDSVEGMEAIFRKDECAASEERGHAVVSEVQASQPSEA